MLKLRRALALDFSAALICPSCWLTGDCRVYVLHQMIKAIITLLADGKITSGIPFGHREVTMLYVAVRPAVQGHEVTSH